jgi:ferritin-like metal-binding protein YciE
MEACDAHDQFRRIVQTVTREVNARDLVEFLSFLDSRMEAQERSLDLVVEEHGQQKRGTSVSSKPMRAMVQAATMASRKSGASMGSDLLTITSLQKMLHYLIASLGSLRAWGELVEDRDAVLLFRHLTDDLKAADRELSDISENELWSRHGSRSQGFERDGDGQTGFRGSTRFGRF